MNRKEVLSEHENQFTLSGNNLIIVSDFIRTNPAIKLYVIDYQKVSEGTNPAECTYELIFNSSNPPDVCYRVIENRVPKTRLLSSPQSRFDSPNRFQLTSESYQILEAFREKKEVDIAKQRDSQRGVFHQQAIKVVDKATYESPEITKFTGTIRNFNNSRRLGFLSINGNVSISVIFYESDLADDTNYDDLCQGDEVMCEITQEELNRINSKPNASIRAKNIRKT